jgi:hypothetical protein
MEAERRRWMAFNTRPPEADQAIFGPRFDGATLHTQAGVMLSRP